MLADSGEDAIAFSTGSDYAANVEMAEARGAGDRAVPRPPRPGPGRYADPEDHRGRGGIPRGRAGAVHQDHHRARQRGPGRAVRARRPRGQRGQGGRSSPNCRASPCWPARPRSWPRIGCRARLHRPRRPARIDPRDRRPHAPRWWPTSSAAATPRARISPAPTGSATRASTRVADLRKVVEGDPLARRQRQPRHRARHRGRPRVPARAEVRRVDEGHRARRTGQGAGDVHGLLRRRRQPHRGRRDRAEPRRLRHHLAGRDGALARRGLRDQSEERSPRSPKWPIRSTPN